MVSPCTTILPMIEPGNDTSWYDANDDIITGTTATAEEEYATLYEASVEVVGLLSIFYGGISIIAVIGNTLVIWIVATTRQMHTVTNMYIANLAFADVIIGMFCIPFQFQAALLQRWNLPEFMCAFCPFIQVLSVNVSVFTLTAIAVDRHRAIINPLRTRPSRFISKIIISVIWIAATSFAIPIAIAFRVVEITERIREHGIIQNITRPFCENVNLTNEQLQTYRYYLVFVQYFVPFCVISFVYIQMAVKLWGSRTPGNAQDTRDIALLKNKKKVIKMLIIVVVVFGFCWFPLQSYNILHVTWSDVNEYRFINIIWFCCDWLAMSNSCYNPFIYGIYNEKFKREFNKRFSVCFCRFDAHDSVDRTMSVFTRASSLRSNYTNTSTRRNNILMQHQQRNAITKTLDGYSTIIDLEKRAPVNTNGLSGNGDKTTWVCGAVNSSGFDVNIATDCACTVLEGDQWNNPRVCQGTCLAPFGKSRTDLTKPLCKATKDKLSSVLNSRAIRKSDGLKKLTDQDDLEMKEYCLLPNNFNKSAKTFVQFNNF